jgi:hypothetical protein
VLLDSSVFGYEVTRHRGQVRRQHLLHPLQVSVLQVPKGPQSLERTGPETFQGGLGLPPTTPMEGRGTGLRVYGIDEGPL